MQQVRAPQQVVERVINELSKGAHFAAWEEPELFVSEVRAGLRSLR